MSWLSKFVFNPIKASIARAATSSNPAVVAGAVVASAAVKNIDATIAGVNAAGAALTANSALAAGSSIIKTLEDGAADLVGAYVGATVGATPAAPLAPEAAAAARAAAVFGEQHLINYISALFSHVHEQINAANPTPGTDAKA